MNAITKPTRRRIVTAAIALAALAVSGSAQAQDDLMLPYEGFLAIEGQPVDGPTAMRFDLLGVQRVEAETLGYSPNPTWGSARLTGAGQSLTADFWISNPGVPYRLTIRLTSAGFATAFTTVAFHLTSNPEEGQAANLAANGEVRTLTSVFTPAEAGPMSVVVTALSASPSIYLDVDAITVEPVDAPLWTETWSDDVGASCDSSCLVDVVDGHFRVPLGRYEPIPAALAGLEERYLRIAVRDSGGTWIELQNTQRLHAAAWGRRTSRADWLGIIGDVDAETLDADDNLAATNVLASGDITAGGSLSAATLRSGSTLTISGTADLSGSVSLGGELHVVGGEVQVGGVSALRVESGDILAINPDAEADYLRFGPTTAFDAVTLALNGQLLRLYGTLAFGTQWSLGSSIGYAATVDAGTSTSQNIGLGTWGICFVGGFHFTNGRINAGGDNGTDVFFAYVDRNGSQWRLNADLKSTGTHESHEVGIVCLDSAPTNVVDRF